MKMRWRFSDFLRWMFNPQLGEDHEGDTVIRCRFGITFTIYKRSVLVTIGGCK